MKVSKLVTEGQALQHIFSHDAKVGSTKLGISVQHWNVWKSQYKKSKLGDPVKQRLCRAFDIKVMYQITY